MVTSENNYLLVFLQKLAIIFWSLLYQGEMSQRFFLFSSLVNSFCFGVR